jgi:hydroxymethylpyrimidine/phosphomethylpyrimidine kinase
MLETMAAIALTTVGSDSGADAGIQADLKSFAALGVYGTCAITAVTEQNTLGIGAIHAVPPDMVGAQIEAVLEDFEVGAVKIGMVPSASHAAVIADRLEPCRAPIALDPVMAATSGRRLMAPDTVAILRERLFPLAACVTPNIDEAAALLGKAPAVSEAQMIIQARALLAFGSRSVLVKGGHTALDQAIDVLVWQGGVRRFSASWVATPNRHGTGLHPVCGDRGRARERSCAGAGGRTRQDLSHRRAHCRRGPQDWTWQRAAAPLPESSFRGC